jgi:UDP-N-acetylglucosamine/UDP-N-acetylgalactosamine diphosphorylase
MTTEEAKEKLREYMALSQESKKEVRNDLRPVKTLRLPEYEKNRDIYTKAGLDAIKRGELALLLLAGGMGTRLGFDGPKGTYPIDGDKSIFECLSDNLRRDIGDIRLPFFIMTSDKNDEATRAFFKEKNYFGYDPELIYFFRQEMAPACDFDGNLLFEGEDVPATSPNGNGGFFTSLIKAGYGKVLKERGVKWLNVFGVDNVLARIADPAFLGAVIAEKKSAAVKAVLKKDPAENVGVVCEKNGHPSIVEYFELDESQANQRDENGELLYCAGVTVNYLFDTSILLRTVEQKMPVHKVKKKIPYIDQNGNLIKPSEPNGYKFEILITDILQFFPDFLPVEVVREKEFAPVKNLHGVDSVDTARELLKARRDTDGD